MKCRLLCACAAALALTAALSSTARADNLPSEPPEEGSPGGFHIEMRRADPAPKLLAYREGQPIPMGYHVETRPQRGLIIGGAVPMSLGYLLGIIVATGAAGNQGIYAAIPVAGPFLAAARIHSIGQGLGQGVGEIALYTMGAVQVVGSALITAGLVARKDVLARDGAPRFTVAPMGVRDGAGIGLVGRF